MHQIPKTLSFSDRGHQRCRRERLEWTKTEEEEVEVGKILLAGFDPASSGNDGYWDGPRPLMGFELAERLLEPDALTARPQQADGQ